MNRCFIFAVALLFSPSLQAESLVTPKPFFHPQDGDTVVFLGDSITHQSFYTQYLENFFFTRYPDRKVRFHNAGVGGDKAADALARFEDDVAAAEPDYVTILLGMNDGQYEPFTHETLETYQAGIGELLDKISALDAEPIALSPTIFDHHQFSLRQNDETFRFRDRPFDAGYNSLLAYYSNWLRQSASLSQVPFVDLRAPLSDITFSMRRSDPDFTLVEDAIHPGAAGHFIMAASILEASVPERPEVSRISLSLQNGEWNSSSNEGITKLTGDDEDVSFVFLSTSLPWLAPEAATTQDLRWGPSAPATLGYELFDAGSRLSQEHLRIDGLPAGVYQLTIDEVAIDQFTADDLGRGVDLQTYQHSPQSCQALEVVKLNRKRNDEVVRPMRDLWSRVKSERRKDRAAEAKARILKEIAVQIDQLQEESESATETIYEIAQPIPRRYALKRVASPEQ